jgi:hypothetical protein
MKRGFAPRGLYPVTVVFVVEETELLRRDAQLEPHLG